MTALPHLFWRKAALALFALVCAFGVAHDVLAAPNGRLTVVIEPPDAKIRLLNSGRTYSKGMEIEPGTYKLDARKDGFVAENFEMVVLAGKESRIEKKLRRVGEKATETPAPAPPVSTGTALTGSGKGRLTLALDPPDAKVVLLKVKERYAPGVELEPGTLRIEVRRDGFENKELEVAIKPGEETKTDVALTKRAEGAPPEPRTGRLRRIQNIKAPDPSVKLTPGLGELKIDVYPPDAKVTVIGAGLYAPGMQVKPGPRRVDFKREGFKNFELTTTIQAGKLTELLIDLESDPTVKSPPPLAQPAPASAPETAPQATPAELTPTAAAPAEAAPAEAPAPAAQSAPSALQAPPAELAQAPLPVPVPVTVAPETPAKPETPAEPETRVEPAPPVAPAAPPIAPAAPPIAPAAPPVPETAERPTPQPAPHSEQAPVAEPHASEIAKHETPPQKTAAPETVAPKPSVPEAAAPQPAPAAKAGPGKPHKPEPEQKGEPGRLFARLSPEDAQTTLAAGGAKFRQGMELPPGRHEVEARKEGYIAQRKSIEIVSGEPAVVEFSLIKVGLKAQSEKAESESREAMAVLALGRKALTEKRPEETLAMSVKAIELAPWSAQAFELKGEALRAMKNDQAALDAFDKALELNPDAVGAHLGRALVFLDKKDVAAACHDYWQACAKGPCQEILAAQKKGLCP